MRDGWKKGKLSDLIIFKNGKKRPSEKGNYPVYGGNGVLEYSVNYNYENIAIIGRVGAYCGSVYYEPNKCWVSDNAIAAMETENSCIQYNYYLLSSFHLNKRHIGTSQPLLTQEILNNVAAAFPTLPEQRAIAATLSCLDDKMELNNKINSNLEAQAQAIFKSWFVDFEPFRDGDFVDSELGPIPKGWRVGTLSELGTIVGGATPSKAKEEYFTESGQGIAWITPKDLSINKNKFISYGELDITESGYRNASTKLMPKGSVLFSSRAPIGYMAIADKELCTNQGFKSVVPIECVGTGFVYYVLKSNLEAIKNLGSGSTFKEVSGTVMNNVIVLIPDKQAMGAFDEICSLTFEKQKVLERENRTLSDLRDTLLPRLMSGEIEVPVEVLNYEV